MYNKMYTIFTDGSVEPMNPNGVVAWAFIVKFNNVVIHKDCATSIKGVPEATGNYSEYSAVLASLLWLLQLPPQNRFPVIIKSDSQLIVNQCNGTWECKSDNLVPLHEMFIKAKQRYGKNITFKWIPREQNTEADELSRSAYDPEELEYFRKNQLDILFDGDDIRW